MNQRARARLGAVDSLFASLPRQHAPEASQLLDSMTEGEALVSSLQAADRPVRIPVQLVRLLALEDRVVLSAEVRARSADKLPRQHEILRILLALQSNAMKNYFRLLEAQRNPVATAPHPRPPAQSSRKPWKPSGRALPGNCIPAWAKLWPAFGEPDLIGAAMSDPPRCA